MNAEDTLRLDVVGTAFVENLDIHETANALRSRTEVAPGMLSFLERAMLLNLGRSWQGAGAIVDAGSFFGSSIASIAEGVQDSDAAVSLTPDRFPGGRPVHGYEIGRLPRPAGAKQVVRNHYGVPHRAGDSFVPILEESVAPYQELVELHIGDLAEESWPQEAPIEIAFIDVCKNAGLNAHVAKEFYPALLPGASTLVIRDYFFDMSPWLKVTIGHLKDYFSWEGQVQSSAVFRTAEAVPADVAAYDPFREAGYEECLALHDAIEFPGIHRRFEFRMRVSRAHLMLAKGHRDDAVDTLKEIETEYADLLGDSENEHGQQFRLDRAMRQATKNVFTMKAQPDAVERMIPDVLGTEFVKSLDIPETADALRRTEVAPGMLSYLERSLIQNLVARRWRGDGAIIDGGSFFGSSIVALAEGIRANELHDQQRFDRFPDSRPIHGYELGFFPLPEGATPQIRHWFGIEYRQGDSFVHILEKAVEPYPDLIRLHIGDLLEQSWPADVPIEVAFIDVCKTIDLNAHVSKEFYPALIPGGSTLINQDFFFDRCPWIKVTMGYLKDYFTWEGQVQSSSIYRTIKEIPKDVAAYDPFKEASYEECLALHDAIEFPGIHRRFEFRMRLSRAYLMTLKGAKDDAMDTLNELEQEYADLLGDHDVERGQQFRFDRAVRQISTGNIFKVV
jgi:hypothetical protein